MNRQIGIVFDCDGTLLDTLDAWHQLEVELSQQVGHVFSKEDSDVLTTLTIPETGDYMHNRFGLGKSGEDVVRMMNDFLIEYYRTQARERSGALSFVRELHERGVAMSVASSSPQSYLQAGLGATGFTPYLEAIVSVDDVGASKREPAVYDCARSLMGTQLAATWVFEDAAYALRTVRAAGYHTVGIYDCDISGTQTELKELADVFVTGYEGLSAEGFLELARRARRAL